MPAVTRHNPKLTLEGAQLVLAAAQTRAAEIKVPMDIAIVDDGGHLLAFARMDGAKLSSVEIAIRKAHCAAIRRLPSSPVRTGDETNVVLSLGLSAGLTMMPSSPTTTRSPFFTSLMGLHRAVLASGLTTMTLSIIIP